MTPEQHAARAAAKIQQVFGEALVPGGVLSLDTLSGDEGVTIVVFSGVTGEAPNSIDQRDVNLVIALVEKITGFAVYDAQTVCANGVTGIRASIVIVRAEQFHKAADHSAETPSASAEATYETVLGPDDPAEEAADRMLRASGTIH